MNRSFKTLAMCAAVTAMLAACGGGDDPDPTNRDSALTITLATETALNGTYAAANTSLSDVQTIARAGATDACEFTFDNIRKTTDNAISATGRVRYIKDETTLNQFSISINGSAYTGDNGSNAVVDRAASVIRFNGKVLTGGGASGLGTNTYTLTGVIPMAFSRPSGC
ncbi:MAG: hypothetical protein EOO28_29330 [Comamonadaceae bacterium]|nr:MAG: hypothetical protein EOO28_29330 [Comamonadaceae bacterium]